MPSKDYTRREAIKYGTRVGIGAALWGTMGHLAGEIYNNTIKPVADTIEKGYEKANDFEEKLGRLNPFRKEPEKQEEQKHVTRRNFLRTLVGKVHEHPVAAGTFLGAAYGAGKYAISGLSGYLTKREIAKLKDESTDYKERVDILEKYKGELQEGMKERDAKVVELERELINVRGMLRDLEKPGELEKTVSERSSMGEIPIILGASGILISIIISSAGITGKAISNLSYFQSNIIGALVFFVSLFMIFIGLLYEKNYKNN